MSGRVTAPETTSRPRANVLGVGVDAVNMQSAVDRIVSAAAMRSGGYVCVTGVHGVMESVRDDSLREIHNRSLLTTPDGVPTVWMGRLQGHRHMSRVYGPHLMLAVCEASVARKQTHVLWGGGEGVASALKSSLEQRFPGIAIVGVETPPFRPLTSSEETALVERISLLDPEYFWVGLSTPKQERFAAGIASRLPRTIFLCVGAAFDMNAGLLRQAPKWMQATGLEWLFRLIVEPKRLWKRYLRNNPEFAFRAGLQLVSGGRWTRRVP